jgi:DNA modification methylase
MTRHNTQQLDVDLWPIDRPIPCARNARLCPQSAIDMVAASIQEFGFRQPIVVDEEGVIICGHTRLLAARKLRLEAVPVHVAVGLTAAQVKAYRLMDNRSNQETSWDSELLSLELEELAGLGCDLALTGFSNEELTALLASATEGLCDPDEVPELPEEPVSRLGDLYLLGSHRLLCGDSTDPAQVRRLMAGRRASLMATDPPYLVDYDGGNHPQTWGKDGRAISPEEKTRHWDTYTDPQQAVEFYAAFLRTALDEALTKRPVLYQWFAAMRVELVLQAWRANGLLAHQILIWAKSRPVLGRCHYMWDYEPAVYGWIEGRQPEVESRPPNNARCVWQIDQREGTEAGAGHDHPTMKPVELILRTIDYHTEPAALIYEPFAGSGTALIAAEMTGRACYAMELSPAFVDVVVQRWERFTGKQAVREGSDG